MTGNKQTIDQQPEKLNQILKQEQRDYDCTPCRVVGMFLLPPLSSSPYPIPLYQSIQLTCVAYRWHSFPRPGWLQLHLRHEPASETARDHPQEQFVVGYARPEDGDLGTVAGTGLDGALPVVWMMMIMMR